MPAAAGQRTTDVMARWFLGRSYGFTAKDVFIGQADCPNGEPIAPGTTISFVLADVGKGPRGFDVRMEGGGHE